MKYATLDFHWSKKKKNLFIIFGELIDLLCSFYVAPLVVQKVFLQTLLEIVYPCRVIN